MCLFYLLWTGILWPVQLLCRAGTSEGTMQCLWGSLQLLTKKGSEKGRTICKISPFTDPFYYYPLSNRAAQPPLLNTPESRTLSEHSRPPQRRTAAWPGGEEREKGRRPSQLWVLPLLANYPLSKSENYNPKKSNHPISSHFQKVKTIIPKNQTTQFISLQKVKTII